MAEKKPLRGEAAYRAQREAIAKANEAASAAATRHRAEKQADAVKQIAREDKRDAQAARKGWPG
ncbi:hypothetical protein C8N24_1970 [Solirubrobacter pauli]|uniref:Uncharacterized protein n=1 Tax=Solirubrobacter pauli TaxID=166793 RepID=A0A660LH76_9ACTN|nr:hypothetical protein [Solirubrobacter pauli]RKQ92131.1 hypothetical protein C8N24_1970 [Solirubrobacter pauli]